MKSKARYTNNNNNKFFYLDLEKKLNGIYYNY